MALAAFFHTLASTYSQAGSPLYLSAGTGNQPPRFNISKIQHVYGIESNQAFAPTLDAKIKETGFEGAYTPVICHVEDAEIELTRLGVMPGTVDCILSVQLLCSVKDLAGVVKKLHHLLKLGGELIFWEHQRNEVDFVTRMVLGLWNIIWTPLQTRETLLSVADWEVIELDVDEGPRGIMPQVWGRLKKM
ncbi:hypothetical protein PT974_00035 [Cladobotryum mycophilum]|uniref:Methyltransferase type 11 domain-containing protein n=1 Tax=Cladobotryum mycophilum TaxID=491253 RepID=A0ABR0T100_9HYPO